MGEIRRINDLVVLGRAAPEPIGDGRETVCLGGYSEEVGWVRLYPTKRRMTELSRWNIVSVPIERDRSHDTRAESYKIAGSKEDWDILHRKVEKVGRLDKPEQMKLADRLATDCPAALNQAHQSLGLVEPERILDAYLEPTDSSSVQVDFDMNPIKGKGDYPNRLYIKYRCTECEQKNPHEQHTIEWEVYKYWDKHDDTEEVIDALLLNDDSMKKYFFVGNLNNRRTAYIIISVLRFKKQEMIRNGIRTEEQSGLSDFC